MLVFDIWVLELLFVSAMLAVGHFRKKGLWFLFGGIVGIYSLLDLSANGLVIGFTCGTGICTETLSSSIYFIPLILIILNLASIISLRRQLGRGAV